MNSRTAIKRVAVCSWSLQPADPPDLVSRLEEVGISQVQLALDPLRKSPATWGHAGQVLQESGIRIVSGMFGCVGEDYSTLDSIRETGGIVPDTTWNENLANMRSIAKLAAALGLRLVTFHAGFVPHAESDPTFATMLRRLQMVAEIFSALKIALGLETGQESAPALIALLQRLDRPNVGVNFDPANMILYNKGDPIQALQLLGPWIRQVHIKDATRTKVPGTWGREVAVGTGEVDWPRFFTTLKQVNFAGDFVIEREAGAQRAADICAAREVVVKLAG